MGKLTTHILDVSRGEPAAGVGWVLYIFNDKRGKACSGKTNSDGRTDEALLEGKRFKIGTFEIVFEIGDYFRQRETGKVASPFLNQVPIRFFVADASQNYHVPLLVSPFGYSTYRGS